MRVLFGLGPIAPAVGGKRQVLIRLDVTRVVFLSFLPGFHGAGRVIPALPRQSELVPSNGELRIDLDGLAEFGSRGIPLLRAHGFQTPFVSLPGVGWSLQRSGADHQRAGARERMENDGTHAGRVHGALEGHADALGTVARKDRPQLAISQRAGNGHGILGRAGIDGFVQFAPLSGGQAGVPRRDIVHGGRHLEAKMSLLVGPGFETRAAVADFLDAHRVGGRRTTVPNHVTGEESHALGPLVYFGLSRILPARRDNGGPQQPRVYPLSAAHPASWRVYSIMRLPVSKWNTVCGVGRRTQVTATRWQAGQGAGRGRGRPQRTMPQAGDRPVSVPQLCLPAC